MNIELIRKPEYTYVDRTIGGLYIDGIWECWTLEDKDRHLEEYLDIPDVKIPQQTAIPRGRYEVIIDYSNRFKKEMPHILNVPLFEGIRIHPGNTPEDTEGCILLGREVDWQIKTLRLSKIAFDEFFEKLQLGLTGRGEVWMTIS